MSCVTILDNDSSLLPPTFGGPKNCSERMSTHDATAWVDIEFKPSGAWTVTSGGISSGGGSSGVSANGNWISGTFNPADYEIRYSGTKHYESSWVGSDLTCYHGATIDTRDEPFDSGWLQLNAVRKDRTVTDNAQAAGYCNVHNTTVDGTILVEIRRIANHADKVSATVLTCAHGSAQTAAPSGGGGGFFP